MPQEGGGEEEDILHEGRLGRFEDSAAKYTSSIDIDRRLFSAVIDINTAHVLMLARQRILGLDAAQKILSALQKVPKNLKLSEVLEDVHMNVEAHVISTLGKDTGGMLNLGKSRNDQVATALRMELREQITKIALALAEVESALLAKAKENASLPMPGYTHLQRAQPETVGHHLLAHYDALSRDMDRLLECYCRINVSPMGSGALASTGIPIDRMYVASILGFDDLLENSLDGVSSRDYATESIFVCAQILSDLSKFAEELVLWTSKEFSFAEIEDRYTSTSSMMPQKKNPVVAEIARAKAAQVIGDLVGSLGIVKSTTLGYNLDLQELTRNLWSATDKALDSLILFAEMTPGIKFKRAVLGEASNDETLYATELADYLVTSYSISFREAHSRVGALVKSSLARGKETSFAELGEEEIQKLLQVPITRKELSALLNPSSVLSKRSAVGSPNPRLVLGACLKRAKLLPKRKAQWLALANKVAMAKEKLALEVEQAVKMSSRAENVQRQKEEKTIRKKMRGEVKQ